MNRNFVLLNRGIHYQTDYKSMLSGYKLKYYFGNHFTSFFFQMLDHQFVVPFVKIKIFLNTNNF